MPARHRQQPGPAHPGQQHEAGELGLDAHQPLTAQVVVDDDGDDPGQPQADHGADQAPTTPSDGRLHQEQAQHVKVPGADGLEHADLPSPFAHGGEQGVGDPERGDPQGDPPTRSARSRPREGSAGRSDQVLRRPGRVADVGDPVADGCHPVETLGHHKGAAVAATVGRSSGRPRRRPRSRRGPGRPGRWSASSPPAPPPGPPRRRPRAWVQRARMASPKDRGRPRPPPPGPPSRPRVGPVQPERASQPGSPPPRPGNRPPAAGRRGARWGDRRPGSGRCRPASRQRPGRRPVDGCGRVEPRCRRAWQRVGRATTTRVYSMGTTDRTSGRAAISVRTSSSRSRALARARRRRRPPRWGRGGGGRRRMPASGPPLVSCSSTRVRAVPAIVSRAANSAAARATAMTVSAARPGRRAEVAGARASTSASSRRSGPRAEAELGAAPGRPGGGRG